ncbi:MAG: AP2 domain-containing protein [Anaerolineae bacterium]|nr:AP2 domain-containing protein [Anaerolineae bacterium]
MADSGYKSISRIDDAKKKTHGWYVRVYFKGKMHSKFFSDARFGDKDQGLQEAIKYRDDLERKLGKPRSERTVVQVSPRNRSGVIGVRRRRKSSGKKGRPGGYEVYEVTWSPGPGKMKRTSVSIEKYGEEEAFRRACEIRRQKEEEIYGKPLPAMNGSEGEGEHEEEQAQPQEQSA